MKDLKKLITQSLADVTQAGIPIGTVSRWRVSTRCRQQWGHCKAVGFGMFEITISAKLLGDDVDDQFVKDTIVHELLHTIDGCMNHGKKWKYYAQLINQRCPGYCIKSRTAATEKGIAMEYRYMMRCIGCNAQIGRHRRSHFVDHPERYRCSKCGGKFERIK